MESLEIGSKHDYEILVEEGCLHDSLRFWVTGWYDACDFHLRRDDIEKLNAWLTEWLATSEDTPPQPSPTSGNPGQ